MPAARNFWYDADRCSAPTKSHQLVRSYSPSRRSLHEVRICHTRAPKNARSSGVRSVTGPNDMRISRRTAPASSGRCGKTVGTTKVCFPYCVESHPCRRREVIRHPATVKRRRAAHGVHDMFVETREEAEPMLPGQPVPDRTPVIGELMSAGVRALVDHRNAAGLASGNFAAFEHNDLEAALDQLVRGAHPGHAAAQNDDPSRHGSLAPCRLVSPCVIGTSVYFSFPSSSLIAATTLPIAFTTGDNPSSVSSSCGSGFSICHFLSLSFQR